MNGNRVAANQYDQMASQRLKLGLLQDGEVNGIVISRNESMLLLKSIILINIQNRSVLLQGKWHAKYQLCKNKNLFG